MSHIPLPEDPLTPDDLDQLRFDTGLRGYRMSQVDAVLDRLRREIRDLDDEVARLRRVHTADQAVPASADAKAEAAASIRAFRPRVVPNPPERPDARPDARPEGDEDVTWRELERQPEPERGQGG